MSLPYRCALFILFLRPSLALADGTAPLWEAGAGVGALSFPDYRGSDHQRNYPVMFPYFIYRGDWLKVDREGIRGLLFESDRVDVDVSLDGAVPVDSDQNSGRDGMPDLSPVAEIGPSLNITLSETESEQWRLQLPLRAAIATDLSYADHLGWFFNPHLNWTRGATWNVSVSVGLLYATEGYHDYYYSVPPLYATAERPVYDAAGGYSGARVTISTSRRSGRLWVGGFVRYDDLSGAVFEESPVLRQKDAVMGGLSLAWIFARSERLVLTH